MKIIVPKDISWNCPEGVHRITLREIKQISKLQSKKGIDEIRMVWQVTSLDDARFEYYVGKNYSLSCKTGSELRTDLKAWLDDELEDLLSGDRALDLETLIGRTADAYIEHLYGPGHEKPFASIKCLAPKGTLDRQAPD